MEKRTPKQIQNVMDKVLAFIKKNPECNCEAITSGLKLTNDDVALPMRKLLAVKSISRKGQARGCRYTAAGKKK